MSVTDYLLIALIVFTVSLYPLLRKFISLMEILVNKYIQNSGRKDTVPVEVQTLFNLKLLAYERIILFIERMKPDSLVMRTVASVRTSQEFHLLLINEIRKEYEYNLSQQLYLSEQAWSVVNNFKNNITTLINTAAGNCDPQLPAGELAKKILEEYIRSDIKVDQILQLIRNDIKKAD